MTDYRHRCTTAECPYLGQLTDNLSCGCHRKEAETMKAELDRLTTPRPRSEYNDDMGDVLWWKFPIVEPPYIGSPNDLGHSVQVDVTSTTSERLKGQPRRASKHVFGVGGWPGYHTHFTPLPKPVTP